MGLDLAFGPAAGKATAWGRSGRTRRARTSAGPGHGIGAGVASRRCARRILLWDQWASARV